MIKVERCTSDNNDFRDLIIQLDADLDSKYGTLQAQYNKYNKIEFNNTVIVVYQDNVPVGCGCYREYDNETVEIKRMFVKPENRGHGIAKKILTELEHWAQENGYKNTVLETGIKQHAAINFYRNYGYQEIDNYGPYIGNTNSICMRKEL